MPTTVSCPTCGKQVIWNSSSRWRPFCSDRCRLIDLGDWLDETHRISDSSAEAEGLSEDAPWPSADGSDGTLHH